MIEYKYLKEMKLILKNRYPKMFKRPLSAIKKTDYGINSLKNAKK